MGLSPPPPPPTTWEPLSFRRCPFAVPPRRDGAELGVRGLRTGTAPPALPRLAVPLSPHPRGRVLHHRSCVYLRLHRVCSWGLGPWRNVTLCRRVSPGRHPPVRAPPRSSAAPGSGRGVTEPGRVSSSPGVAAAAPSGHAAPIPAGSARPSARGGHGRALRGSAKRGGYGRPEGTGRGGPRGPRSRTARRGALLGPRLEARWSGRINIARGSSPARRKSKRASRAGGYFQSKRRGGASCAQAAVRLRFRGGGGQPGGSCSPSSPSLAQSRCQACRLQSGTAQTARRCRAAPRTPPFCPQSPAYGLRAAFPTGKSSQVGGEGRREGPESKCPAKGKTGPGRWERSPAQFDRLPTSALDLAASLSQHSQPGEQPGPALTSLRSASIGRKGLIPPRPPSQLTSQDRFHTVSRSAKKGRKWETAE